MNGRVHSIKLDIEKVSLKALQRLELSQTVEEQTASFEEVSASIGFIDEKAKELTQIVEKFKI